MMGASHCSQHGWYYGYCASCKANEISVVFCPEKGCGCNYTNECPTHGTRLPAPLELPVTNIGAALLAGDYIVLDGTD